MLTHLVDRTTREPCPTDPNQPELLCTLPTGQNSDHRHVFASSCPCERHENTNARCTCFCPPLEHLVERCRRCQQGVATMIRRGTGVCSGNCADN